MDRLTANPTLYAPVSAGQVLLVLAAGAGLWATALGVPALWFGLPSAWPTVAGAVVVLAPLGILVAGVKTRRRDILLGAFPVALAACALANPRWTALPATGLPAAAAFGAASLAYFLTVQGPRGSQSARRRLTTTWSSWHRGGLLAWVAGAFAAASIALGLWVGLGDDHAGLIDEAWGAHAPIGSVLCVWLGLGAAVAAVAGSAHRSLVGRPTDGAAIARELGLRHARRTRRAPSRVALGVFVALLAGLAWWKWHVVTP